jgi:CRP/FNR family transcriptional regulator, cyclic AMP receptor protein
VEQQQHRQTIVLRNASTVTFADACITERSFSGYRSAMGAVYRAGCPRETPRKGTDMKRNDYLRQLAAIPLLSGCTAAELAAIARSSMIIDIAADRPLTVEGRCGQEFFVIISGVAEVTRDGDLVARLGPGDFAGELSLLTRGPRTATVRSLGPVKLLVFSRREFDAVLQAAPTLTRKLLEELAQRLVVESAKLAA